MKLRVTHAHALTPRLVEVEALGPRGGAYHFAAYYERSGALRLLVETSPTTTQCLNPGDIDLPSEIVTAASGALRRLAL